MRRQLTIDENIIDIKTITPGDAVHFPKNGDSVLVHYIGSLADGTVFDNSYGRDRPLCFLLGANQVIAGWEIGVYNFTYFRI